MTTFTINEDFPKNEIEFDARFSNAAACYDYLFKQKWPDGFACKRCGHRQYCLSSRNLYICTQCEHDHSVFTNPNDMVLKIVNAISHLYIFYSGIIPPPNPFIHE